MDNRKRLPTPATVAPVPGTPSDWATEAAGARCAKAHQGAQPWGSWGCKPPAWERPRRGGDRASEARRGAMDAPLWGAIYPEGANNIAQQCVVSPLSCKVAARALLFAA